ncbi:sigma-54-dependent Fis family transcriptional regulator [Candidatus Sumerlaeota bacterium]|nr:sigma-54-dependent Fis family transcriptional regulator [Candidatus Sumerlaeota bacterium]
MATPGDFEALLRKAEAIDLTAKGVDEALGQLMPLAAEHFGAEFASLLVVDGERQELRFRFAMGEELEQLYRLRLRVGEGIAGAVALGRRSSRIGDVAPVPQHHKAADEITGHVTRSLLAVPVIWSGEVLGVVEVVNRIDGRGGFDDQDAAEARALASLVAGWLAWERETTRASGARPSPTRHPAVPEGPVLVGAHPSITRILDRVIKVAPTDTPVLVFGESGTGKELIAQRLHLSSGRIERGIVTVDCGTLDDQKMQSALFGHVVGAFTGAVTERRGAFREADGGTLFLDEIGNLSPECQGQLLRAIQFGEITPLGADKGVKVDARLVCATDRDLQAEVEAGRFSEPLYHRINVVTMRLPPLRERREDIPVLAEFFLHRANERLGRELQGFSPDVLALFEQAPWRGNVRELENTVMSMAVEAEGDTLELGDIPPERREALRQSADPGSPGNIPGSEAEEAERRAILDALQRSRFRSSGRWNVQRAAKALGLPRKTLEYKIKVVYGLQQPESEIRQDPQ